MCGIAGIINYSSDINTLHWLSKVSEILSHRGNDDDGIAVFDESNFYASKIQHSFNTCASLQYLQYTPLSNIPAKNFPIGLLHRRLSIIDLSEYGHQPMCDESGDVWITYNGEVYNYLELRKNLEVKGIRFFSNTDTEVLLKAYIHYGKDFVSMLNGMWAFCIYDRRINEIFLSRDRIGVKPLYYYHNRNLFAFASEQKAFLKSQLTPFEINYAALSEYLTQNILESNEEGLFKNILELQPGEIIAVSVQNLAIKKEKYFQLNQLLHQVTEHEEENVIKQTRYYVNHSIQSHLRSDVEVAVSLSGGIDSSVIAVGASHHIRQLHTFSIVFPNKKEIDESDFIDAVNKNIQTHAHLITPTAEMFFNDIDELLYSQDIPIWSTSTYNQFLLMKEVKKQNIKVILSGQGSDELFAGYLHHYLAYWNSLISRAQFLRLLEHLQQSQKIIPHPLSLLIKSWIKRWYLPQKNIFSKYLSSDIFNKHSYQNTIIEKSLNTELIKDLSYRRLKAFLKCEDRCSMWHSVESRLPFSDDIELLQWAFRIPENVKLKNGISKYVLREAFKNQLPQKIYQRRDKKAFDAPLKEWMLLKEQDILNEIKNGWREIINVHNINTINSFSHISKLEAELLFKLFILNRWKKIWK